MINEILADLAHKITNAGPIGPLIAIIAGFLTSLTPCSLSSVPLIIGYVKGSGQDSTKRSFALSVVFALGMTLTFVGIGVLSGALGRLVGVMPPFLYIIVGIFLVLMAIQTWGVYYFIKPNTMINKSTSRNYLGALVSGLLAGFFASPCTTPVMLALVSLVISSSGSAMLWGLLLFVFYAIGHSIVTILAGTFSVSVMEMTTKKEYKMVSKIIEIVLGILIFILGVYFISLGI